MTNKRVLVLGASNVSYQADGPSTGHLLQDRLRVLDPQGGWSVRMEVAPPGRNMAARAEIVTDEAQPAVVIVSLPAAAFTYEFVTNRLRRRWPAVYGPALRVSQLLKQAAGGDADTAPPTSRGLIYRVPEWIALQTIGGETGISVEHALQNATATLEVLARREDVALLVRLPVGGMRASRARAERYRQRLAAFRSGMLQYCAQHHIQVVDPAAAINDLGRSAGHGSDGIHLDLSTRAFEAEQLADAVLAAVDVGPA